MRPSQRSFEILANCRLSVTIGQMFRKGDIKQSVLVDAGRASVQADVKRRYDDGSVRFAVISLCVPKLDGDLIIWQAACSIG